MEGLPYVDEHAITIRADRDAVWSGLERFAAASLVGTTGTPFTRLLGAEPPAGFEIMDSVARERLTLTGHHRFSRYMLAFDLADAGAGGTRLRARTWAAFPGLRGRAYRALVIGTRIHVLATNRMLRAVERRVVG